MLQLLYLKSKKREKSVFELPSKLVKKLTLDMRF